MVLLVDKIEVRSDLEIKVVENIEFILKNMAPKLGFIDRLADGEVFSLPIAPDI